MDFTGSVFIGDFKIQGWELKYRKGKAGSLRRAAVEVTQGFPEGEGRR